ncbi:cytochrome c [Salinicoccus sp. ID82-1]|uniref:Cytochrome c n=1 Tax=Salinicoccus cyprini TaxID=2493691 RepID=A0A558AR97_9STAP|nr:MULTISPECIES: cytochrome c [Salinicoccus]MCG1010172.1 cytochrome c [Salinicoccus sp. ID82-1]TVT26772.1 cytochrome c [Salinicoccus cyprini]
MKKFWILMSFAMVLVLGACGGNSSDEGTDPDAVDETGTEQSEESTEESTEEESSSEEGDSGAAAGDAQLAQEVYQQNNCMGCHGQNLEGGSGPALTDVGSRLSEDEIRTRIEEGGDGMPAGLVTDEEELDAVVQWLSSQTGE